ncbi:MBL fold metallo-hydrolase [bacterium]|nr:MBL fold metallo-hydrolase [bacterium]
MKLGEFEIHVVSDGLFKLDGGSMFGVVPKIIWQKTNPSDDMNRIELGLNCLLIRTGEKNILVDTGMGDKWDDKMRSIYDFRPGDGLLGELAKLDLEPEDIDIVIQSHLHLDHAGGSTRTLEDGSCVPTFPKARYVVQKGEWDVATNPDIRSKPSYMGQDFLPLQESGQLEIIDGDTEILPGVRTIMTPGHTMFHQSIIVESGGEAAIFLADLIPTTSHVRPNYTMGFDLYPMWVIENRIKIIDQIVAGDWLCVFEHDPKTALGRLKREGKKVWAEPV